MHPLHEAFKDSVARDPVLADCRSSSTATALELLSTAMKNPGHWILIKNHFPSPDADKYLMKMMDDIICKLELRDFQFSAVGREWFVAFGRKDA